MTNQLNFFKCPWCGILNPIVGDIDTFIYKIYSCGNYYDGINRGCDKHFKLILDLENYYIQAIKN